MYGTFKGTQTVVSDGKAEGGKGRGGKMTDVIEIREKSKKRFIRGIRFIGPIKSNDSNDNVLRPNFGGHLKPVDTNTANASVQMAERVLTLGWQKGQPPEQAKARRSQDDDESGHGEPSGMRDE
jgi:hypothetical protein